MRINKSVPLVLSLMLGFAFMAQISNAKSAEAPMVKVDGGEFKSGSEKKPVNVKTFQIDKFEVTFARFHEHDKEVAIPAGKENHPVVEISYFDAEGYCKAVGKRLPTALEWEKAARGVDGFEFPWGNEFKSENTNTSEAEVGGTTPVGSYKNGKSPYGAMDMAGNVWEWVDGWDGKDKKYRLAFGGSFFDEQDKSKGFAHLKSIPDDIHTYIGFRCAK